MCREFVEEDTGRDLQIDAIIASTDANVVNTSHLTYMIYVSCKYKISPVRKFNRKRNISTLFGCEGDEDVDVHVNLLPPPIATQRS